MEIVINLPERAYKEICSGNFDVGGYFKRNLRDTFRNGTPLPKGHGNLIDENELIDGIVCEEIDGKYYDVVYANCIYDAATIIETDKGVAE